MVLDHHSDVLARVTLIACMIVGLLSTLTHKYIQQRLDFIVKHVDERRARRTCLCQGSMRCVVF